MATESFWEPRAVAVEALGRIGGPETVEFLIQRLHAESGRMRGDVAAALNKATGQGLSINPDLWGEWWANIKDADDPADAIERLRKDPETVNPGFGMVDPGIDFFGVHSFSHALVYVIDSSGSMKGDRWNRVTRELKNSIRGLFTAALFNIVFYDANDIPWQHDNVLEQALLTSIRSAIEFIDERIPLGPTNYFDPLCFAFNNRTVDTIIFVSDGRPTVGRITDPEEIEGWIRDRLPSRQIRIHTVAIGPQAPHDFLRTIADISGGQYVEVE
jgi:hypothetical protein